MEYSPMKGRWSSLAIMIAIAAAGTALSVGLDSKVGKHVSGAPATAAAPDGHDAQASALMVVNADGSTRRSQPDQSSDDTVVDAPSLETLAPPVETFEQVLPPEEMPAPEDSAPEQQTGPGGRID